MLRSDAPSDAEPHAELQAAADSSQAAASQPLPPLERARTIRQLAIRLGVSTSSLQLWSREPGFPQRMEVGGYSVDAVRGWLEARKRRKAERVEGRRRQTDDERDASARYRIAKAGLAELELAKRRGELVEVATVTATRVRLAESLARSLRSRARRVNAQLEGKSFAERQAILDADVEDTLAIYASADSWESAAQQASAEDAEGDKEQDGET